MDNVETFVDQFARQSYIAERSIDSVFD